MLSSRFASIRSLSSFIRQEDQQSFMQEPSSQVLHLPPSFQDINQLSPALWNWITKSHGLRNSLESRNTLMIISKVLAYAGQSLTFPPEYASRETTEDLSKQLKLERSRSLGKADSKLFASGALNNNSTISISSTIATTPRKSQRKAVGSASDALSLFTLINKETQIPRFLLQLQKIQVKTNTCVNSVYCVAQVGNQRFRSRIETCNKESEKGFGLVVSLNEVFLFDLPRDCDEFTVTVRVYSGGADQTDDVSHSTLANPKMTRRRSMLANNITSFLNGSTGTIADAKDTILGEISFSFATMDEFPKVCGSYALGLNGVKKEILKCGMQMGLFMDQLYTAPIKQVHPLSLTPKIEKPYMNYLNIYVHTKGCVIWKKYWCILVKQVLAIYDYEYKRDAPVVAYIPMAQILQARAANRELIFMDFALELELCPKFLPRIFTTKSNGQKLYAGDMSGNEWESVWKQSVVEHRCGPDSPLVLYATAENETDMKEWEEAFTKAHI